jgi:hypothetical protein
MIMVKDPNEKKFADARAGRDLCYELGGEKF